MTTKADLQTVGGVGLAGGALALLLDLCTTGGLFTLAAIGTGGVAVPLAAAGFVGTAGAAAAAGGWAMLGAANTQRVKATRKVTDVSTDLLRLSKNTEDLVNNVMEVYTRMQSVAEVLYATAPGMSFSCLDAAVCSLTSL
jgi:hypothetical protein